MKKKLLAAAVAACLALTTMLPAWAAEGETKKIANAEELAAAIAAQQDGETWELAAGEYVLTEELMAQYADVQPGTSGQGGWYFPITASIKIVGAADGVVLTSDVERPNGAWASQDFISVWADGVTIENVDIQSKVEINKAVEIMAKNFTMKDVNVLPQEADDGTVNSGSVYFNTADAGESTLENVTVSSWITARDVKEGNIDLTNVTIDFSNNTYAGSTDYGVISGEKFANNGLTVKVDNAAADLDKQILSRVPAGTVVELTSDIELDKGLIISADNITIDGKDHRITAGENFANNDQGQPQLVKIYDAENVTLKNALLQAKDKTKHVLDVHTSKGIVLENLTLDHSSAGIAGAPLIINYTDVTVKGTLGLITGDNSWYGINLDNKSGAASIEFAEGSSVVLTDNSEAGDKDVIQIDMGDEDAPAPEVKNPENAGLVANEDGTYREEVKVTGVGLDIVKKELKVGESFTLTATVKPDNADDKTLTWSSSDDKVATVDANGKVTAVAAGTATITVKAGDELAECVVTVTAATVTDPDNDNNSDNVQNPDKEDNGDTGVVDYMMLFAVLAIVSAGAVVFTVKKAAKR